MMTVLNSPLQRPLLFRSPTASRCNASNVVAGLRQLQGSCRATAPAGFAEWHRGGTGRGRGDLTACLARSKDMKFTNLLAQ